MPNKNREKRHAQRKKEKAARALAEYRARPDVKRRMEYWERWSRPAGEITEGHVTVDGTTLAVTNATITVALPKHS